VTVLEKLGKTGRMTEEQMGILRAFNREFLVMAGYDQLTIGGYGDLASLGPRQMDNLIRAKMAENVGQQIICPKCHTVLSKEVWSKQST
jgi:hypothetical protein